MAYFDNLYASSSGKPSPTSSQKGGIFGDIYSQPSRFQTSTPSILSGNQPQPSPGIKIGSVTINPVGAFQSLTKTIQNKVAQAIKPVPKLPQVKLPDGTSLKIVQPKAVDTFDLSSRESSSAKLTPAAQKKVSENQAKVTKKVDELTSSLGRIVSDEARRLKRDVNSLTRGVVSGMGQVAPREEYETEEQYQKAVDKAIKYSTSPSLIQRINKDLGPAATAIGSTFTLGKLAPDAEVLESLDKEQKTFYTVAQLLPLAKVPLKLLVKFAAVDLAFNTAFTGVTGKEKVSELLPEDTSPLIRSGVDVLEFLGKAYIAHGIKPGAIRDKFTKSTIERYNLPKEVTLSSAQLRDIHQTGKLTTAQEKQLVTSLKLSSKEYAELIRGKKDITIKVPTEKVIEMVDKSWWAKVKSIIGQSSEVKTVSVTPAGQVTQSQAIAGLLPPGEYTPRQVQSAVIGSAVENTVAGRALIKASVQAQQAGANIQLAAPQAARAAVEGATEGVQNVAAELVSSSLPKEFAAKLNRHTDKINALEESIKRGDTLPPIPVYEEGGLYFTNKDGDNRLIAYQNAGVSEIPVRIEPKTTLAPDQKQAIERQRAEERQKDQFIPTIGVPKLAQGVRRTAIKNKLTTEVDRTFKDLPEYDRVNVKDQAAKATEFLLNSPDEAFQVAMGLKNPPGDILPESVFVAMEKYAIETRNVDLMRELATRSRLTSEATGMGQRIRMLAERDIDSPVKAIRDVQDARRAAIEKKGKTVKETTDKTAKEIKKAIKKPDKHDWGEFIKSIEC